MFLKIQKCFEVSFDKAVKVILDHQDDPEVKALIIKLLNGLVVKDDNLIDDIIVNVIKEKLYPLNETNNITI